MKRILAILMLVTSVAHAQFGPTATNKFPYASSTPANGVLLFNQPGTTNYNVAASNAMTFLNAVSTAPMATTNQLYGGTNALRIALDAAYAAADTVVSNALYSRTQSVTNQTALSNVLRTTFADISVTGGTQTNIGHAAVTNLTERLATFAATNMTSGSNIMLLSISNGVIANATINSNKMDAATLALFATGGGNPQTNISHEAVTNLTARLSTFSASNMVSGSNLMALSVSNGVIANTTLNSNKFDAATITWIQSHASGGSQTPWASDINGANFSLTNAGGAIIDSNNTEDNVYGGATTTLGAKVNAGVNNTITGIGAMALGDTLEVSGDASFASGIQNVVSGDYSHASGIHNNATGNNSHAAGENADALHNQTYAWSDGNALASTTNNQWSANAQNGFRFLGGPVLVASNIVAMGASNYFNGTTTFNNDVTGDELHVGAITSLTQSNGYGYFTSGGTFVATNNGAGWTNIQSTNIVGSVGVLAPASAATNYTLPLLTGSGNDTLMIHTANTNVYFTFSGTNNAFVNRSVVLNALTSSVSATVRFASGTITNLNLLTTVTNGTVKLLNFFNMDTTGTNVLVTDGGTWRR